MQTDSKEHSEKIRNIGFIGKRPPIALFTQLFVGKEHNEELTNNTNKLFNIGKYR